MRTPSLPFKILAFAPFLPEGGTPWRSAPLRVDKAGVDRVMEELGVGLSLPLPRDLCPAGEVSLAFRRMRDFHPDALVRNTPWLNSLFGEPPKPRRDAGANSIDDLLKMVDLPGNVTPADAATGPPSTSAGSIPERCLRLVYSDGAFRNLESAWRGLELFLVQGGADGDVSLEIVPVSFDTLEETLEMVMPLQVEDLPSLILLDLPFDGSPRSLELLGKYAFLAENLLAPALFWISPKFFHLDRWQSLDRLPYLPHRLEDPAFAKWRRLAGSPAARWIAAMCNPFLVRFPYGPDNRPAAAYFEETQPLWISPVWATASLIGQSLRKYGWPTRFTDWRNIRLERLAMHAFEGNHRVATEASFSEDRIRQFIKCGITPLASYLDKDIAFLPAETAVAGDSLARQLFLSRVTRLLIWCKDNFPKDLEPAEIEEALKDAFTRFWERSGMTRPDSLSVSVGTPNPEAPALTARISVEPSGEVLPSGGRIELEFSW